MADFYLRQTPLAHLGIEGRSVESRGEAGVALSERTPAHIVDLRGDAKDKAFASAVESVIGCALPVEPNTVATSDVTAIWLGPDEWWIVSPGADVAEQLRTTLAEFLGAVTVVGDSRACIRIAGPHAHRVLQKGCPLDFHPRAFAPGRCAQSHVAKAAALIHRLDADSEGDSTFDIYVLRSFADYLWRWLDDAAREFGVAWIRT